MMTESVSLLRNVVDNVEKVIMGKRYAIELALIALMCKGHILIEDVPGVGKTSLASALARSINCSFSRIQFTPDVLPSDIVGFSMYNPKNGEFEYKQGSIMSQFVLADEINRTSPKTQSSLLEAMEEHQVTVDGNTYPLPSPFFVLATQNPIEYMGTFPLPEAQLDRFFMKIVIGYPHRVEEQRILERYRLNNPREQIEHIATGEQIIEIQEMVTKVHCSDKIYDYIVSIVSKTREMDTVALGCSPRASIALMRGAQAVALYNRRDYVTPDDVQEIAPNILSHRIIMSQDAKFKKIKPKMVIAEIISNLRVPTV